MNGRTNGVGIEKPTNRFGPFDCQSEIPTFARCRRCANELTQLFELHRHARSISESRAAIDSRGCIFQMMHTVLGGASDLIPGYESTND